MHLGLTVVTHVPSPRINMDRCTQSVKDALPTNARHKVIEAGSDYIKFQQHRYDAMSLDDVVIFVDHDDYISKTSLSLCMSAISSGEYGLAFTNEIKVLPCGGRFRNRLASDIMSICDNPEVIHHMSAYRTKYVSDRSINLATRHNSGIEWIMRVDASTSSPAGAIGIPTDGYYWVQHPAQANRRSLDRAAFITGKPVMTSEMKGWVTSRRNIPVWTI